VIQIEYEMSEKDFLDSQKLALRHSSKRTTRWIFRIAPLWGLFLVLAVLWKALQPGFTWTSNATEALFVGLLFFAGPLLYKQITKTIFRKNAIFRGPRSLTVDEAGLNFTNPTSSVQVKWDSFQNFVEDDTAFALYQSGLIFHTVPKRQLSQEQIAELRETFTSHVISKT